jgi:uncharacterized membrane protein YkoI
MCLLPASTLPAAPTYKGPKMEELPEAAQKAIKEQLGDGKLVRIEETMSNEETVYRIEFKKDDKDRSFSVDDEGKLRRLQMSMDQAPASVQAAIREHSEGGTVFQIDKVLGEEGTTYEVEMTKGGRDRDFVVNTNGELCRMEVELGETPEGVRKGIRARLGSGRLVAIQRVVEKGQTTYRVEMTRHRKPMPFSVSSNGKLVSAVVGLEETPPAVQRTIRRQVGEGYLDEVQLSIEEGEATYDVTYTKADETKDFTVLANGRLEK